MVEFICSYYNSKDDVIDVVYDTNLEKVLIINTDTSEVKIIDEQKNMRLDMFCFIADDFYWFIDTNDEVMAIDREEINYIKDECKYEKDFIDALKEYNVKIEGV